MDNTQNDPASQTDPAKVIADYAVIMEMVGQLAGFASEQEQVERIFNIFTLICAPRQMSYLGLQDDGSETFYRYPASADEEILREQLLELGDQEYLVPPGDDGFIFRVRDRDRKTQAVICIDRVMAPELLTHYLNMALNIRSVLSLAIANARLYQQEQRSREQIEGYAGQLELLHEIGLSLNRETDQQKLMASLLEGAARLTGSGVGAVIQPGGAGNLQMYRAPWYGESCSISAGIGEMHATLTRLVDARGRDVVRITGEEFLTAGFGYPAGHAPIRELLLGAIRDTQGRAVGHFVLSEKTGGASFTAGDEQIISLLAAQAAVALTSARNFQREHRVAEALQNALLPMAPVRQDVDFGLLYQAAGHARIGGDFYEVIELDDRRIAIAVGDVCGKGLQAATYNAMARYLLRAYLRETSDPGQCLSRLNAAVQEELPDDRFITLALAVIDTASGELTYSSAGHPYPIVSTVASAQELYLPPTMPLGVMNGFTYPSATTRLELGASILMYTDGITEARSPGGEQFGNGRLLGALSGSSMPVQELVEELKRLVMHHADGKLKDDMAILVMHFKQRNNGHGRLIDQIDFRQGRSGSRRPGDAGYPERLQDILGRIRESGSVYHR